MDIQHYLPIVKRWWWLPLITTTVAAIIGYGLTSRQPLVYGATATMMVGQSIQSTQINTQDLVLSERLARTYAQIARHQPILEQVAATLALSYPWQALKNQVTVTPARDTQLLYISAEANSPEMARLIADEVARQLILLSPTGPEDVEFQASQQFVQRRLVDLQAKIDAGQQRLQELEAVMTGSISAAEVKALQSEINTLERLITDWENNYTQLLILTESQRSPNYLAITEPAQFNATPLRPNIVSSVVRAAILGFMLAVGLIFFIEHLDDTFKSMGDFKQGLDLPALGSITLIKGKDYQDKLISGLNSFDPIVEIYRMVRSNIQFMSVDHPLKSVMVTSAEVGEGKSITVANLGIVMAQAGLKTVIVDADLRRPMQQHIFQVPNLGGLTTLLRSPELEVRSQLMDTGVPNLFLLPAGMLPPNPAELLGSQRLQTILNTLAQMADIVIYDSPPALVVTDAAVLSSRVDGVVLVVKAGKTRRETMQQTVDILQHAGANLIGGLLNQVSRQKGKYYYKEYYSPNKQQQQQPLNATPKFAAQQKVRRNG